MQNCLLYIQGLLVLAAFLVFQACLLFQSSPKEANGVIGSTEREVADGYTSRETKT